MLTLAIATLLAEAANKASFITGGNDGLQGIEIDPIGGLFRFDMFGRTGYLYCLIVLFFCWVVLRVLLASSFGQSLVGIRENVTRMHAIGAPVAGRLLIAYAIGAAMAGIAGGLLAQTTQFVGQSVLSFERSGEIVDHAGVRRHRPDLWRLHRRRDLHDRAGPTGENRAGVLELLDRR